MFPRSFLRFSGWTQIMLVTLVSAAVSACSEPECPEGLLKVGKSCRRPDAGAMLDGDAAGPTEAGVEPVSSGDAASGATSDAAIASDATVSTDATAASDAGGTSSDASSMIEAGSQSDATAGADADTNPPAEAGSDAPASCSSGYVLKSGACQDVDECFEGTHQCHMTSTCKNTAGSYDCECPLGYSGGTSAGFACAPRIAVGGEHACVLLLDGTVQCWGKNTYGQLGDGTQAERAVPVTVPGLRDVAVVSAGGYYTCALLKDTSVRCWGDNSRGSLGDGTMMNRASPVSVNGLTGVIGIDTMDHVCAALGTGAVKCWGPNTVGQLGSGAASQTPSLVPVGAKGVTTAAHVFVGNTQTCVVLRSGATQCWGEGFLGMGTWSASLAPVSIDIPAGVRSIAYGYRHACALLLKGNVYCWGTDGAANDGVPRIVPGTSAISLSINFYSTYAVRPSGAVALGFLQMAPTDVTGFPRLVAIDAFFSPTNGGNAIADDGRVISWMINSPQANPSLTAPTYVSGLDLW